MGFQALRPYKSHKDRLSFGDNVVPIISDKILQVQHNFDRLMTNLARGQQVVHTNFGNVMARARSIAAKKC